VPFASGASLLNSTKGLSKRANKHPNVVKFEDGTHYESDRIIQVMKPVNCGNLEEFRKLRGGRIPE
jgi:hypothetical protein